MSKYFNIKILITASTIAFLPIVFGYWFLYLHPEKVFQERIEYIETQFKSNRAFYTEKLLGSNYSSSEPLLLSYFLLRSDGAAVGANVFEYLIYDKRDEITRAPDMRSPQWMEATKKGIGNADITACKTNIKNIENHFYAAIVTC